MFAKERYKQIATLLKQKRSLTAAEIRQMFGVSNETVRRDLAYLEGKGVLRRVHGGAMLPESMREQTPIEERLHECIEEKRAIARGTLTLLSEGDTVFVDSGSTAVVLAEALADVPYTVTAMTHSPEVFRILERSHHQLILLGGHYTRKDRAFYGPLVLEAVEKLHAAKAIVFPDAVSLQEGVSTYSPILHEVERAYVAHADTVLCLADSSKFDCKALLHLPLPADTVYVTDKKMPAEEAEHYREAGFDLRQF